MSVIKFLRSQDDDMASPYNKKILSIIIYTVAGVGYSLFVCLSVFTKIDAARITKLDVPR